MKEAWAFVHEPSLLLLLEPERRTSLWEEETMLRMRAKRPWDMVDDWTWLLLLLLVLLLLLLLSLVVDDFFVLAAICKISVPTHAFHTIHTYTHTPSVNC